MNVAVRRVSLELVKTFGYVYSYSSHTITDRLQCVWSSHKSLLDFKQNDRMAD